MEAEPPKKRFWIVPFSIHAARGLVRDERARRKVMSLSVILTVAMLGAGLTILQPWLDPHEHPWRFVFFWLVCAWVTLLVILLALFDLLLIRAAARAARKAMREEFTKEATSNRSGERIDDSPTES